MQIIHAYKKLTHRYNPAWAHLDESEYMGFQVKAVFSKPVYSDYLGESVKYNVYLTASKPVTQNEMHAMLHAFDRSCRCEHDCCGHFNGGAFNLKRISRTGKKWQVELRLSANV